MPLREWKLESERRFFIRCFGLVSLSLSLALALVLVRTGTGPKFLLLLVSLCALRLSACFVVIFGIGFVLEIELEQRKTSNDRLPPPSREGVKADYKIRTGPRPTSRGVCKTAPSPSLPTISSPHSHNSVVVEVDI